MFIINDKVLIGFHLMHTSVQMLLKNHQQGNTLAAFWKYANLFKTFIFNITNDAHKTLTL